MAWPQHADNVGILAIEVYIPESYVCQADLEVYDKVPEGKYTKGLGQVEMAFCGDDEDPVSMAMSAVQTLLDKHSIDPKTIGRLDVGTESGLDRSKSVKSYLMQLFTACGNFSIQGTDCVHACFGATAAVLAAADWIEGRAWDGRFAIVVATDAAIYPPGSARASGGAAAAAMLIGPDAPLALNRECLGLHFEHSFDFYKPAGSHYPKWDALQSMDSYLRLLRLCYATFCDRYNLSSLPNTIGSAPEQHTFSMDDVDHLVVHAPFNRLVQKALATLMDVDQLRKNVASGVDGAENRLAASTAPGQPCKLKLASRSADLTKVQAGMQLARHTGNTYTASLWCGLASLLSKTGNDLKGRQVLLYSYGSGAAGCLFALRGRCCNQKQFSLESLSTQLQIPERLTLRDRRSPEEFTAAAALAEARWCMASWRPGNLPLSRSRQDSSRASTSESNRSVRDALLVPSQHSAVEQDTMQQPSKVSAVYKLTLVDAAQCRFYQRTF